MAQLIADLNHERFAVREAAARELRQLGELSQPGLEMALARPGVSLETRQRLEQMLSQLPRLSGESLRDLRAIEVLERLDTPEARALLEELAKGDPDARLTHDAKASLERLRRRPGG